MFGVVELSSPVPVEVICPQGVARVENEETFVNGLTSAAVQLSPLAAAGGVASRNPGAGGGLIAAFLALPIWTPSTVRVYCRQLTAAEMAASAPAEAKKASEGKPKKQKLAVLPLVPRAGIESGVAELFTDALVGELRKRPD